MAGRYQDKIDLLTDEHLFAVPRKEELGATLNFEEAVPYLRSIRRDLVAANDVEDLMLPQNNLNQAQQYIDKLPNILDRIRIFDPKKVSNAGGAHADIITELRQMSDEIATSLRPVVPVDQSALDAARKNAERLVVELEEELRQARDVKDQVKSDAVQKATGEVSGYYKTAADSHESAAMRFLWFAVGSAVLLMGAVVVLFYWIAPTSNDVPGTVREISARIVILLVLVAAVGFCTKNYRVNMHLSVINKTRYNALETAALYVAGVDGETRNLVVAGLVHAIFSPGDTGYMSTDREQTIIENPGSISGLMTTVTK